MKQPITVNGNLQSKCEHSLGFLSCKLNWIFTVVEKSIEGKITGNTVVERKPK